MLYEWLVCPSACLPQPLLGDTGGTSIAITGMNARGRIPTEPQSVVCSRGAYWKDCSMGAGWGMACLRWWGRLYMHGLFWFSGSSPPLSAVTSQLCFSGGWAASTGWHHISLSLFLMHLFDESKAARWVFTALLGTSSVRLLMQRDRHSAASLLEKEGKD